MIKYLSVIILLFSILCGCGSSGGGGSTPTGNTTPVSYTNDIQPIFDAYCISCHVQGGAASFLSLAGGVSYNNIVNQTNQMTTGGGLIVKPGDAANSVLYQRVSGSGLAPGEQTMPPPGGGTLAQGEKDSIRDWISDGANNN